MTAPTEPWIDWVVVERAVAGYPPGRDLTRWERTEAAHRLITAGHPNQTVMERTGLARTTVRYYRHRTNKRGAS